MMFLIVVYLALYFLNVSGYYDGNIRRKVEFTDSQIEAFERDIAAGEQVDIKDYLKDQTKDYTNNVSRFGYKFSTSVEKFVGTSLDEILKILSKLLS